MAWVTTQVSNWVFFDSLEILNPNMLRGDLTWGLPKLQIEWSNGLTFESKHVGEINLRLQICLSLKLGGSTVWHLNPNMLRDDLTWGLPKLQIEWSNGLES